jgi:hypothetical protein
MSFPVYPSPLLAGAYLSYENSIALFHLACILRMIAATNSGGGPNRLEGPKHSPDHIGGPKDILLKPICEVFFSKYQPLSSNSSEMAATRS